MAGKKGAKHGSNPPQTFICLGCKKPFRRTWFPSRQHPQYCCTSCRKSHRIIINCATCNKPLELPPCRKGIRKYCSNECSAEGQKRSKITCEWCSIIFRPTKTENRFCSLSCSGKNRKSTRLKKICEICNKSFQVKKGYTHARFCSMKCSAIGIAKKGPDNPSWKGGHIASRGLNWKEQANKARKRDKYTCQLCALEQRKPRLSVHHIIPFREYNGDYKSANKLSNLITYCISCHLTVEYSNKPKNEKGRFYSS